MIKNTSEQYLKVRKGSLQVQAHTAGPEAAYHQGNHSAKPETCLPPAAHTESLQYCAINQCQSAKQKKETGSRLHTAATSST